MSIIDRVRAKLGRRRQTSAEKAERLARRRQRHAEAAADQHRKEMGGQTGGGGTSG